MTFDHEFRTQIKSKHIDGYGHVNNAVYLQLFEEARWDWIALGGGSRDMVEELGVGPIVADIEVRFSRELKEGEKIIIRSTRETPLAKVYWLKQVIYKESGEIACKSRYRLAFMDIKKRVLAEPPQGWIDVLTKDVREESSRA